MLTPHALRIHIPAHLLGLLGALVLILRPSPWWLAGFLAMNLWVSGFGMSVGFHRFFTHRAFKTGRAWYWVMLIGGSLSGQGSVIFWTALHRLHHPHSDQPADIHSPRSGFWHAYMGWIFDLDPARVALSRASDLARDRGCRWTHRHYDALLWSWWALLAAIAAAFPAALPCIAGMLFAGMWSIHQEALINSACHVRRLGVRNFDTPDDSTNLRWLSWLTWGQSLHNNHHARPGSKTFAVGPREFDPGAGLIALIETNPAGRGGR